MTSKKTRTHKNAIYAINNKLHRLKRYHKDVPQTANFNKYVNHHKEYAQLKNRLEDVLKEGLNYEFLREIHLELTILWMKRDNYKFPNLYHYAIEDTRDKILSESKRVYNILPSYRFYVAEGDRTINDDGLKVFKTSYEMWRAFNAYHDTDSSSTITFNEKDYHPHDRSDCIAIFKEIEVREASQKP